MVRERRGTVSDIDVPEDGSGGEEDSGGEFFETVAKVPPWMEGVEASAEYEEMKPTLDVIKRTVLLAMLQQVGSAKPRAGDVGRCVCACLCCLVCGALSDDCSVLDRHVFSIDTWYSQVSGWVPGG